MSDELQFVDLKVQVHSVNNGVRLYAQQTKVRRTFTNLKSSIGNLK